MLSFDKYLSDKLRDISFGSSVEGFVFCCEIANFEDWGEFFLKSRAYTSYRPKQKELLSVGQLRWNYVKDLAAKNQLLALRDALLGAVNRVGDKPRRPKDFDYIGFGKKLDELILSAPESLFVARPAASG